MTLKGDFGLSGEPSEPMKIMILACEGLGISTAYVLGPFEVMVRFSLSFCGPVNKPRAEVSANLLTLRPRLVCW